jgi:hypothetical protein
MSEYMTRMRFFWQCLDPSVFGKAQFLITMVTKIVNKQLYSDKHKHMYIHIYIYTICIHITLERSRLSTLIQIFTCITNETGMIQDEYWYKLM